MKSTTKRVLSVLLCMALVLAVMPMAFAADTTRLYCDAPDSWTNCNIYWWGSSQSNPGWPGEAMTQGADGIWYYDVPSDAGNVIFNNGSTQTSDLAMPTDDNVQYNYEAKSWGTYGSVAEPVETVYYLRGTMNNWGLSDPMTKVDDTTYTITMDLAAGTYEYKAAIEDWSWSCPGGGNLKLTLEADDTVTFTLDLNANSLTYTLSSGTVVEVEYFLRGTMNEWSTTDKMVKQADGTYAITLSLSAGTYEYKAATADWSFSVPGGDNAVLTLTDPVTDVTFVLDVAAGTLTNDAPATEEPEPVEYTYYVAGSTGLCGVEWDPAANAMTEVEPGIWQITFTALFEGTYEYKVTTGSWETPSYGPAEGGNYTVVVKNSGDVTITFNEETKEVTCSVRENGEDYLKFQLNADASADDATVDLRMITYVDSLDYESVKFYITIEGEVATWECEAVYESINVSGAPMTCEDIFGFEGYLVTFTLTDIPAQFYGSDIQVYAEYQTLGSELWFSEYRTIVLSNLLA